MSENLQTTNDPAAPNSDVTIYHFCSDPFVSKADYDRLRAEVEQLRKVRDYNSRLADSNECDATAAEKSRDEAIAELNKALETLGQLRSDLQRVEEERDQWERAAGQSFVRAEANEDRAQSAEASLAKLRGASAHVIHDVDDLISHSEGVAGLHMNSDVAPWDDLTEGGRFEGWLGSIESLRSLLDEPDKDQRNAKL